MLSTLREKSTGLFSKIILGAIVIAFSFFGIESYFVSQTNDSVAQVGDHEISQQDFRARFDEFRQRQLQQLGGSVDAQYFENPELKRQVLDQMVDEQVMLAANDKLGIVVPAERLRQEIMRIPAFQRDGQFDPDMYRAALASQGLTPSGFDQRVRQDIAVRALPMQIVSSAFVTDAAVDAFLRLQDQQRDFRYIRLDKPAVIDEQVSADDVAAYYKDHQSQFMLPEEVALEYIELDGKTLEVDLVADDATLEERYEKEKNRFVSPEQRLASHILIKVDGKGSPEDQKAALEKAEEVAALAHDKKDFAELAKEYSSDLGSKSSGGDLGWMDKDMTDPAFDQALYALDKGEISAPVLSPEGYHIIWLRDVRPGSTRSFAEVKDELAKEFSDSERERVFNEKSGRMIDLTYQDSSSLATAAKELGLTVQRTGLFSRDGDGGIAANPAVVRAAFSDQVKVQGENSDAVELGPDHVAVVRMAEHKPAAVKPLDEVSGEIQKSILTERARAAAKERADKLFARIGKGESLQALAAELELEVKQEKGIGRSAVNLDSALVDALFEMPRVEEGKPDYRLVALNDDSFAIVQLDKVIDPDLAGVDQAARESARNGLQQLMATESVKDFVSAVKSGIKIKVFESRM